MAMVQSTWQMEGNIRVSSKKAKLMVKEHTYGLMEEYIMEIGNVIKYTEKDV